MSNTVGEATPIARPEKFFANRGTALLLATDGTPQSDAAVSIVRLLAARSERHVSVLTVVDHAPIPWGTADRSLVLDYERGLRAEAEKK
jgi:nucleotide-binding universal stress UspA family protein